MRDPLVWVAVSMAIALTTFSPTSSFAQGAAPSEEAKAEASTHFRRGAELFQDGIFRAALVELKRAYEIAPNYRVLYNIGQTHVALGEFVEAIRAFEEFLRLGGAAVEPARRSELESELARLRRSTAQLAIRVSQAGATVSVDGKEIGKAPLSSSVSLDVGQHRIAARTDDGASASQDVTLAGGDVRDLTLTLVAPARAARREEEEAKPLEQTKPPMAIPMKWSIGLLASAGVLAIAGGGLALAAKAANDEHQKQLNTEPGDPAAIQTAHDQLARRALAADIMFGGAIAAGVTGLVLMLTKGRSRPDTDTEAKRAARVRVRVGFTPRALVAEGRF